MLIDNETTGEVLTETTAVRIEKTSDGKNMVISVGDYTVGLTEKEIEAIMTLHGDDTKRAANLSVRPQVAAES